MKRAIIRASMLGVVALALVVPGSTGADRLSVAVPATTVGRGLQLASPPRVVPVRGTRVYHAPALPYNYFVYRYSHYMFSQGTWLSAEQYDGPWTVIPVRLVPPAILAVPVHYYKNPPADWKKRGRPPWAEARDHHKDNNLAGKQRDTESDG